MEALTLDDPLSYSTFNPEYIKWQYQVLWDQANRWEYDRGVVRCLFSGSIGSSKTTAACFMAINHCTKHTRAKCLLGRRSLPDLRDTIYMEIVELLENDEQLMEGEDYVTYDNVCRIYFPKTKSEIFSRTWGDKRYKKFRSLKLSMAIIEEATENDEQDKQAIREIMQRLNRVSTIKENTLLLLTNPDSPSHWIHKDFIERADEPNTWIYYSLTEQNPFLDPNYITFLRENLTPKEADRQLRGMWVEIDSDRIYYNYQSSVNFKNEEYKVNPRYPIDFTCDFNIGEGKPMSWALGQYIDKTFHIFKEYHAETMRTENLLDEMEADGIFDTPCRKWRVFGDASGKHKDTRSNWNDYEIIASHLAKLKKSNGERIEYELNIPRANPPLRRRHNEANALFGNDLGQVHFYVYKGCEFVDEGFRLTRPKKGAKYEEDDGPACSWQHVTTAITYYTDYIKNKYIDPNRSSMRKKV